MPTSPPHHRFHLEGRHGHLTLNLQATLAAPWTILFGPSGSGKTTVLRALAGLIGPTLDTRFDRHDPGTGTWQPLQNTPPHQRHLAYDPQTAPLLPHLTAADNIRFPERLRHIPTEDSSLPALTDLLQLTPLLPKHPHQLSGGERQRISLARALAVPNARLLLLDEPFAGLDRTLRDDLVPRLRAYLTTRNLPVLSVTHDPDEALLLQAEVLRFHDGQFLAQGPALQVLADELQGLRQILDAP